MTRDTILEKALELFTGKGYVGTSMDDIAKAVGIRKASLYSHFDGKESIFSEIFNNILDEYVRFIDELMGPDGEKSVTGRLEDIFMSYIRYCKGNLKMYFWDRYFYYPPEFLKDYIAEKTLETQEVFLKRITSLIEQGMKSGEIKEQAARGTALAFYYLMIGLSMSVRIYSEEDLLRDSEDALGGLMNNIKV
jgi:AcrR family transcriptional regulator